MNKTQFVTGPRFSAGSRVRVKIGVRDPDLPDVHLGDWTGTVAEVEIGDLTTYLIHWSPKTLRTAPPVLRDFCQKEDAALDEMWLLEEDLEPGLDAPWLPRRMKRVSPNPLPARSRGNSRTSSRGGRA